MKLARVSLLVPAFVLGLLSWLLPTATAQAAEDPPDVGIQFHGTWDFYDADEAARTLDRLEALGAGWVRIDISWPQLQPARGPIVFDDGLDYTETPAEKIGRVIDQAHARGLKVLGMFWLTPGWANGDKGERFAPRLSSDYADALTTAARHWKGKVQAWEVWNEPNSRDFFKGTGGSPQTDREVTRRYVNLLCKADDAMGPTGVPVVSGGTQYNDWPWVRTAYEEGLKGCYDYLGVHPYNAPSNAAPNTGGNDDVYDFNALKQVRAVQGDFRDYKSIWATEMGWSAHANTGDEPPYARGVSEQDQARFTIQALNLLTSKYPYVGKAFIYNERPLGEGVHVRGYGIMNADLSPRPVYDALQAFLG